MMDIQSLPDSFVAKDCDRWIILKENNAESRDIAQAWLAASGCDRIESELLVNGPLVFYGYRDDRTYGQPKG
jgi:hypothetical protein